MSIRTIGAARASGEDTAAENSPDTVVAPKETAPLGIKTLKATASKAATAPQSASTTIEIRLAVPKLPKLPSKNTLLQRLPKPDRRTLLIASSAFAIVGIMAGGSVLLKNVSPDGSRAAVISPLDLPKGTPKYATLLPAGKSIEQLGGWTRISPPDRNVVFAYTDKIGDIPISVSQQPLPDNFTPDTSKKVEELALSFQANQKLVIGETEVFIGSSASGPQSVIFAKDGVLILMKSSSPIDPNKWGDYVNSLQ